ncbi:MAG: AMP-binding protein [Actinobacteria bacterium]|nr:AMP-binding protein [Actinomycetota bacterium]
MALTESHAYGPLEPPVRDLTIGELLREAASDSGTRVALVEGTADVSARRSWTYAELLAESEQVAAALLARFEPGDHIAIWAPNIPEWVIAEFGIALAGMVIVTVNPAYQKAEVQYVLSQSRSKAVLVVDSFRGNPLLATANEVQADCPDLTEVIRFAECDEFLASGNSAGSTPDLPQVQPLDKAMIQYTSGTTGFPKGALLHHRGLVNNAYHYLDRLGTERFDIYVAQMPLFHTAGSVMTVLGATGFRCTQVLIEVFEPGLSLELSETYGANSMFGVPTMLVALLEHPDFESRDLSSVNALCSGGALVPEQLVRTLEEKLGAKFTIVFGQTECSPVATMTSPNDTIEDKAATIGLPMPHVEIKIVDTETGDTMQIGGVGELCTRGYHVMHGYFEMEEETTDAIDAEGWLRTGDLAAMDDRGYCTIEGRLKDMIIRGGENIYPKELEELLFGHPSVGEVAVVGLPDDKWGETVGAFVRPAPGFEVDKVELFNHMRENLAPHKTPKQWFALTEFPLTGSGKIQKFRLRDQWVAGEHREL